MTAIKQALEQSYAASDDEMLSEKLSSQPFDAL